MKSLLTILTLTLSLSSFAESIDFYEAPANFGGTPRTAASFQANKELGRAWISMNVDAALGDSDLHNDWYRTKVDGLSYDSRTDSIVLDVDGRRVTCAYYDHGSLFRLRGFKEADCSITSRRVTKTVDDGYETYKRHFVVFSLNYND